MIKKEKLLKLLNLGLSTEEALAFQKEINRIGKLEKNEIIKAKESK